MPITPGSTGASFDVLLAFSLDQEANRRVNQGISTLNDELERIQREATQVGENYEKSGEKVVKTSKEITRELQAEARVMRREAAAIVDDLRAAQISTLKNISGMIGDISQKALIAGSALTIGIFAEVNQYVKNVPQATQLTREWEAATTSLGQSRARVDNILLREALPLLQQAAKVAGQAAGFVERHPEIVSAALKTGIVLAGLGAIGILVSKGIKLVADVTYLATIPTQLSAAKLQDVAADKQLAAAQLRLKDLGGAVPGGGGGKDLVKNLPVIGLIVAAGAASIAAADQLKKLEEGLVRLYGRGAAPLIAILDTVTQTINPLVPAIKNFRVTLERDIPLIQKLLGRGIAPDETDRASVGRRAGGTGPSRLSPESMDRIVDSWSKWREEDARLVTEAAAKRKEIIEEGEKQIVDITRKYSDQRSSINARADSRRSELIRNAAAEDERAEAQYRQARSDAIRGENEQLAKIAEDHQERIRQIERDGAERLGELAASRDALGLAQEQRRIEEDKNEANRSAARAAEQVRRETAARLTELAIQFEQERAQRRAQLEQALKENEAQRQEELKQAAAAQQEELRQAREAQAAKLRELQEGLNAERIRRREVFIAEIRDLDANLLGERKLKQDYYRLMLKDASEWLAAYRRALGGTSTGSSSGATLPIRDSGGYVDRGVYKMAWDRAREFVLSGPATRAAEKIVGGSLTQNNLMSALSAGSNRNISYIDQRRLERPMSKDDRAAFQRMAEEALLYAIGA